MSQQIKRIGPLTWEKCYRLLEGKDTKNIGPNTWIQRVKEEGVSYFVVRLYSTCIISFHPNGRIHLWTDGYRTVTTKQRLTTLSGHTVYSKGGTWYVDGREFTEGIEVGLWCPDSLESSLRQEADKGCPAAKAALADYLSEQQ